MTPTEVYFDESGLTGNNLLHPEQPTFAYASVVTTEGEAKELIQQLRQKYVLQGEELKGNRLTKSAQGRRALLETLRTYEGRLRASVSDKKYALAAKFFEYIFEPCVSKNNSLLYAIDFHRFISNVLYMEFKARGVGAEDIFTDFERLMRTQEFAGLDGLFGSTAPDGISPILAQIREFAIANRDSIMEELDSLPGDGVGKWILDLTNTSLFSLLADWGQHYEQLTAFCDQSKPLEHDSELLRVMVGRSDKKYIETSIGKHPITFNLAEPPRLVDSKSNSGIQIADFVAAACVYGLYEGNADELGEYVRGNLNSLLSDQCIFPDFEYLDLTKLPVQRNAVMLIELHQRSMTGRPLLEGLEEYIEFINHQLVHNPLRIDTKNDG